MTPPLWQKVRGTKEPLDEGERGKWKSWLKTQHSENKDRGIRPITSWQIDGETMETVRDFIFLDSKITTDSDCSHEIKRRLLLGRKAMTSLDIKKQRHYFADKSLSSQSYDFSSSHVQMWELDNKKGWVLKNWCPWTVVFEKTLESPLESKEIKPVNPKGNQSWIFIGGLMLKMKCQFFGHLMRKADSMDMSLSKLRESVMPSSHPLLLVLFSLSPSPPAFNLSQWVNTSYQVAKISEFQLQHQSSNEYSGLISFRIDWFDLLAVQRTLKSLLQHHSSKASILRCSTFFVV